MGYTLSKTAPSKGDPTAKNRVWDFFDEPTKPRPENRRQPLQPRRKNRACSYKTASGIPYWPSRDPIEEVLRREGDEMRTTIHRGRFSNSGFQTVDSRYKSEEINKIPTHKIHIKLEDGFSGLPPAEILGGINLYGFTGNFATNKYDVLGLAYDSCSDDGSQCANRAFRMVGEVLVSMCIARDCNWRCYCAKHKPCYKKPCFSPSCHLSRSHGVDETVRTSVASDPFGAVGPPSCPSTMSKALARGKCP